MSLGLSLKIDRIISIFYVRLFNFIIMMNAMMIRVTNFVEASLDHWTPGHYVTLLGLSAIVLAVSL